ncbi:hypothetical protein EDM56_25520 [Brevibacillus fluminis]|uniref:Uncharacterized protein n=1 Tax=Brevibacillus fluminis TaxID=511487 RepID=A0A3M8D2K0_9BACL|nr:hypothetical protein EDM56_25520 [Brevibacillus fluminis]
MLLSPMSCLEYATIMMKDTAGQTKWKKTLKKTSSVIYIGLDVKKAALTKDGPALKSLEKTNRIFCIKKDGRLAHQFLNRYH